MGGKQVKPHVPIDPAVLGDVMLEESERGCILVGAAFVEERLADAISAFCVSPEAADALFGSSDEAAATFSRKTALAFALGIITSEERDHLDKVRKIRNAAAHFERGGRGFLVGFEDQSTQDRLATFTICPRLMFEPHPDAAPAFRSRLIFEGFVHEMAGRLGARITTATRPEAATAGLGDPSNIFRHLLIMDRERTVVEPMITDLLVKLRKAWRIPDGWYPPDEWPFPTPAEVVRATQAATEVLTLPDPSPEPGDRAT